MNHGRWIRAALLALTLVFFAGATQSVAVAQSLAPSAPLEPRTPLPALRIGVHGEVGAAFGGNVAMGGGALALRLRPIEWIAVDLALGYYVGVGYQAEERSELLPMVNALFFINPHDELQVYALGGVGVSFAVADTKWRYPPGTRFIDYTTEDYIYVGGQIGAGVEWRVGRHFAVNTDLRAFIRSRVDDYSQSIPDYTDPATGATTNTSAGLYWTGGVTAYW